MRKTLQKIPLPMAGLALALAGLGRLLQDSAPDAALACVSAAGLVLVLLVLKLLVDFPSVRQDLRNPILAAIAGTFSMGLLIIPSYLAPRFYGLAIGLWSLGLLVHLGLLGLNLWRFIRQRRLAVIFPSTFIPFVGLVAACASAAQLGLPAVGQAIFWFGLTCYLGLLPLTLYRVVRLGGIPDAARPTLAIFAAPASLCLAAYLNLFGEPNPILVLVLAVLALVSTLAILPLLRLLLQASFLPSLAAFGFPLVVSALAMKSLAAYLAATDFANLVGVAAQAETVLALAVVVIILVRYLLFLYPAAQSQTGEAQS